MSKSRRKQNTDITRIVGILFLEVLAAIVLLNLVAFAKQQRTQSHSTTSAVSPAVDLAQSSSNFSREKSLPKVAVGRYNVGW